MHNNNYKNWSNLRVDIENIKEKKFPEIEYSKQYLTIEAITSGTVTIMANPSATPANILYSTNNGSTWTSITPTSTSTSLGTLAVGEKILFKGVNSKINYGLIFGGTAQSKVYGNIMSLIYGDNFIGQTSLNNATYTFYYLFSDYTNLISAENLVLPATILTDYCYAYMFYGCTSLVKAPELPATTLANYCYSDMFYGCTSLTTTPELPATTLKTYCYSYMFNSCTSLIKAPELPAKSLPTYCYSNMFRGCTSLKEAPELPATSLNTGCYEYMFYGCTLLTILPTLPVTTLQGNCYRYMFYNCSSLTTAPKLPATTLASNCYSNMFRGCTSLKEAPELPATTLVSGCYDYMFYGCSKLNYIKALFTTTPSTTYMRDWLYGVASEGTFVKSDSATWTTTGTSAAPSNWNIYKVSDEQYLNFKHDPIAGSSTLIDSKQGSFTFYGATHLQTSYDYVGMQIGDSVDKWQLVGISGIRWRLNENGGTNTNWTAWETLIDTANISNYLYQKSPIIELNDKSFGFTNSHNFNELDITDSTTQTNYSYISNYIPDGGDFLTYIDNICNGPIIFNSNLILRELINGDYKSISAESYKKVDALGNITELGIYEIKENQGTLTSNTYVLNRGEHYSLGSISSCIIVIKLDNPSDTYQNVWSFDLTFDNSTTSKDPNETLNITFKDSEDNVIHVNWTYDFILKDYYHYEFSIRYNRFATDNYKKYFGIFAGKDVSDKLTVFAPNINVWLSKQELYQYYDENDPIKSQDINISWSEWRRSIAYGSLENDHNKYDFYESYGNWHKGVTGINAMSEMQIKISGLTSFNFKIRETSQALYDFIVVLNLDDTTSRTYWPTGTVTVNTGTTNKWSSTTPYVKASGKISGSNITGINSPTGWTDVSFSGITTEEHTIRVIYGKNKSTNYRDDRGYIAIPKEYASKIIIPYDKEIEYLESNGNQYILPYWPTTVPIENTFNRNNYVYASFSIDTSEKVDKYIVSPSTWNNPTGTRFSMGVHSSNNGTGIYTFGFGKSGTGSTYLTPITQNDGEIHTWEYKANNNSTGICKILDMHNSSTEEVQTRVAVSNFTSTSSYNNIKLFYGYNSNTKGKISRFIHSHTIGNNMTSNTYDINSMLDLIPVRKGSIGYLYDKTYNILYSNLETNQSTGAFILGPDIYHNYQVYDAELEWLETTGNCYFSINYIPKGDDIRIKGQLLFTGYSDSVNYAAWYGAYTGENNKTYRIIKNGNSSTSILIYNGTKAGGGGKTISISSNTTYSFDFNRYSYKINNITGTWTSSSDPDNTSALQILTNSFKGRIYYFKVYKDDILQVDLIPVQKNSVGYLYDRVNGILYSKTGSGTLSVGPSKP